MFAYPAMLSSFVTDAFTVAGFGSLMMPIVHHSGLIDQVRENDRVSFDMQDGRKGLNAVNVKVI